MTRVSSPAEISRRNGSPIASGGAVQLAPSCDLSTMQGPLRQNPDRRGSRLSWTNFPQQASIHESVMTLITKEIEEELAKLYSQEGRAYHTLDHVRSLLALLNEHRKFFHDPDAVEAAIWLHDAVYSTGRGVQDNEARSAELARQRLFPAVQADVLSAQRLDLICAMIEATAAHVVPAMPSREAVADAEKFLDLDLSILAASETDFDKYEAAVRQEYSWATDDEWREGRAAVLESFLPPRRESIFHSELFASRLEAKARANIQRSLRGLRIPARASDSSGRAAAPQSDGESGAVGESGPCSAGFATSSGNKRQF
jgi:predicted metal-dependent HD superfamily phosphohydrolase